VSCHSGTRQQEKTDIQSIGDTLIVSENSMKNKKIKLETVTNQLYSNELNTTGTVKAIAGQLAEIAPRLKDVLPNHL
jgi:hypothetical protein